jgi:hypothetical protein
MGGSPPAAALSEEDAARYGWKVALLRKVCAVLRAYAPLAAVAAQRREGAITHRDEGNVQAAVDSALRLAGVSLVAGFLDGANRSRVPGVVRLEPCRFTVGVFENPVVNRAASGTGVTCDLAVEHAICALNGLPLANGVCGFDGFQTVGGTQDGLQASVAVFTTALTVRPPAAYFIPST